MGVVWIQWLSGGAVDHEWHAFDVVLFAILTFKFSFYGLSTFDSAGKDFSWLYFVLVCAESTVHGFYCSLAGCVLFTVW